MLWLMSSLIPYSTNTEATFENFIAACPICGFRNIFNRASDFRTFEPMDFREVTCQECSRPFNINGDAINAAYEMLLFDCRELIERKQYMRCVLNAAQAYEVFFNHFLYVQLVYRPFANDGSRDLARLNQLMSVLCKRVRNLSFRPMRDLTLHLIVHKVAPASLGAAEAEVARIPRRQIEILPLLREHIEAVDDDRLRLLLLRLSEAGANTLRNRVVHKDASRPTQEEAQAAYKEAREILFGLTGRLRLGHDITWYIREAGV
jgi:hypothetical protein